MLLKSVGKKVLKQLNEAGFEAYFVGGMVRDTLLGCDIYDVDITTDATPEIVMGLFDKTVATGLKHGTVTVVIDGVNLEVTTFRVDGQYLDNRRPDEVVFTYLLENDLARRDFTINAIAQHLDGTVVDPFGGEQDLGAKLIRAVGQPIKRFEEDALRILRGIRFVAKLGFDVEGQTLAAMKACRHLLANLSMERIRKEFEGIIEGEYRIKAFRVMLDYQLFDDIPYFQELAIYDLKDLTWVDDLTVALLLIENSGHVRKAEFRKKFPLTRQEKKLLEDVDKIKECDILAQYYFGIEVLQIFNKYENAVGNEDPPSVFTAFDLPIKSRQDLVIGPEEMIKLSGEFPGPWINRLFNEIEEAVVLRKIGNIREELVTFIKERGIFNEEEN